MTVIGLENAQDVASCRGTSRGDGDSARTEARGSEKRSGVHRRRWLGMAAAAVALLGSRAFASQGVDAPEGSGGVVSAAAPGGILEAILFYAVASSTIIASVGVCVTKNIVRMAVWLFVALGSIALLYFLLAANFLGAIQLIVYVGGTLVLLIFGVMLTSKSPWARFEPTRIEFLFAGLVCGSLVVALSAVLGRAVWSTPVGVVPGTSVAAIGRSLLTTYLVPFEVAGVLLMIVMVGAAHLARQEQ